MNRDKKNPAYPVYRQAGGRQAVFFGCILERDRGFIEDEKEGAGKSSLIGIWSSSTGLAPCSVLYLKPPALLKNDRTEHSAFRVYDQTRSEEFILKIYK
jgi:hypothetical protein